MTDVQRSARVKTRPHQPNEDSQQALTKPSGSGSGSGQVTAESSREFRRLLSRIGVSSDNAEELIDERYRLQKTLGRGAMGVVYLARDERLRRQVALKLVRMGPGMSSARLHERLEREARALAKVDHPNVVHIHDVGTYDCETYLTMQYVPGTTLRVWQSEDGRSRAQILDAYIDAARGLAAAHAEGIAHRDFKPDNVLVGDDGGVRVVDFGIAAAIQANDSAQTSDMDPGATGARLSPSTHGSTLDTDALERLTGTGTMLGTLPYMAPEQILGLEVDERADQFGFCVALWEALTGARPFKRRSSSDLENITEQRPEGLLDIPRGLRPVLSTGLAPEPGQRFADMNALIDALLRYRRRGRRLAMSAVLVVGVVASALGGWGLSQANQVTPEPCESFTAELDPVWNPSRHAQIAALGSLDQPAVDYALARLDALAQQWRSSAASLCEDGVAPAKDSRERECRVAWLASFERSVALIAGASDAQVLARVPDLVGRLVAPEGDYCALVPEPLVDLELAQLGERAREAAVFGDSERALALADEALARAETLADRGGYSVDRAEALLAQAEVWAQAGDYQQALAGFAEAEAQAHASGHRRALLLAAIWRAKVASAAGGPERGELAAAYFEAAEPIAAALELGRADPRRGEMALAAGMIAQARGDSRAAIASFEDGRTIFERAGRPTLAAKALNNIGVNYIILGQYDDAVAAHREAIAILTEAGVPAGHRSRVSAHYSLGTIAVQRADISGLDHFDHVARYHPSPSKRLRALNYGAQLAHAHAELELAWLWAERGLTALAAEPEVDAELAIELQLEAGAILAASGDARGQAQIAAAIARAEGLGPQIRARVHSMRLDSMIERQRCAEAQTALEQLEHFMATQDATGEPALDRQTYETWRAAWLASPCELHLPPKSNQDGGLSNHE